MSKTAVRPTLDSEIEITPEMIEAGAEALGQFEHAFSCEGTLAEIVAEAVLKSALVKAN